MSSDVLSFEGLISVALEARMIDVHTCIPGIVQSVDNANGTVDVSIAIKRVMNDGSEFIVPTLQEVPVIFMGGGGNLIAHSLTNGDEGLIIFQERDFSSFDETGSIKRPVVFRKHDYSDAVFLPANVSKVKRGSIPDSGIEVTGDLQVDGDLTVSGDITVDGKIEAVTGDVTAMSSTLNISLAFHTHIDSAGSPTQPPTPTPAP